MMKKDPTNRLWSCYPLGVEPSRRTFLRALAGAAGLGAAVGLADENEAFLKALAAAAPTG